MHTDYLIQLQFDKSFKFHKCQNDEAMSERLTVVSNAGTKQRSSVPQAKTYYFKLHKVYTEIEKRPQRPHPNSLSLLFYRGQKFPS